jgi:glycosyltransferase involved in cell wall biosynthesis
MRVALFTETFLPKIDGIVTVTCLLLDHLTKRGIDTVIVAPKMGCERYNQTPVIGVPGVRFPLYPELRIGPPTTATFQDIKHFAPDIAHFIHPAVIGVPGMLMASYLGIPKVASFHIDVARIAHHYHLGFIEPVTDVATRVIFNKADVSLAPSKLIQADMERIGIHNVRLWKRGVNADKFNPRFRSADMRARLSDGHPDDTLLIYVGRLGTEKQIDQIKAVMEQVPGTRLALVGDGPARDELAAHFEGLPVVFAGYLSGTELSEAYASADIFVFPSALETFGLVVVEAMAAGLPVVASRVGGVRDVVEEGVTGYTFEVDDIDAMVAGVRQIARSRAHIEEMGRAARAFAETQSWDAMMDEVIDLYAELIAVNETEALLA